MSEIYVTLSGNVAAEPRQFQFRDGSRATSLRLAVNRRSYDRETQTWQDEQVTFYTVRCYRALADHVAQSVRRGHPIIVSGKLRIKQFERDSEQRFWVEVEAMSVGHDLKWGISSFDRPARGASAPLMSEDERRRMEDDSRDLETALPALRAVPDDELPFPTEDPTRPTDVPTRPTDAPTRPTDDPAEVGTHPTGDPAEVGAHPQADLTPPSEGEPLPLAA
ncbi:single-stranded DNA-binding protein [Streptosporangiaceae bacterium NEAU-GS5]|nr:single-stranded DNA-binding protein [Streptosporangiaceae bacterium NEAU-GS5]